MRDAPDLIPHTHVCQAACIVLCYTQFSTTAFCKSESSYVANQSSTLLSPSLQALAVQQEAGSDQSCPVLAARATWNGALSRWQICGLAAKCSALAQQPKAVCCHLQQPQSYQQASRCGGASRLHCIQSLRGPLPGMHISQHASVTRTWYFNSPMNVSITATKKAFSDTLHCCSSVLTSQPCVDTLHGMRSLYSVPWCTMATLPEQLGTVVVWLCV